MSEKHEADCLCIDCAEQRTLEAIDASPIVRVEEFKKPTTGYRELDRDIDRAVDAALLRIKPALRDMLRQEIKRYVNLEEA